MERNLISERTRMALQHLKDTGKRFTYDKYGWDIDEDNNFVENEKEQYWIEYMKVRCHEDNISISQIARELNTCGVPTKRGGKWCPKQVSRILKRLNVEKMMKLIIDYRITTSFIDLFMMCHIYRHMIGMLKGV